MTTVTFEKLSKPQRLAAQVAEFWETEKGNREKWEQAIDDIYSYLYSESTRDTPNANAGGREGAEEGGGWRHSVNIPQLSKIRETLVSNYVKATIGNRKWLSFEGRSLDEQKREKRELLTNYIRDKHRLQRFSETWEEIVRDFVDTGVGFWNTFYTKEIHPSKGTVVKQYPETVRISPRDIVFRLDASSFKDTPKVIRSIKDLGEIVGGAEEHPLGYEQEAVERLSELRRAAKDASERERFKQLQDTRDGVDMKSMFDKNQVEILEFYGSIWDEEKGEYLRNRVITVADRRIVLRNEPIDTPSGRDRIGMVVYNKYKDSLLGNGPLSQVVGIQYLINHFNNGVNDAIEHQLYPEKVIIGAVKEPDEDWLPNVAYRIPGGNGDVKYLTKDLSFLNVDGYVKSLMQLTEEVTGAVDITLGVRTKGEKTAFEVQTLNENAFALFRHKAVYLENNGLEPIVNDQLDAAADALSGGDSIRVEDDEGFVDFIRINRKDLEADGELRPVGAKRFDELAKKVQDLSNFQLSVGNDQGVRQHFVGFELAKYWNDIMDFGGNKPLKRFGQLEENAKAQRKAAELNEAEAERQERIAGVEEQTDELLREEVSNEPQ